MKRRDPRSELPIGTVLGESYRLVRRIADGGMGTVYEAEQLRLGKRCAVKVMAPELAASRDALARFHREVEVTSQLNHPHIIQVMDFGTGPGGEPYLVMELLEGEDLAERLRRSGRLTPAAVVHIVKQVASALAATHAGGIVHRDLKPANVFLIAIAGASEADSHFVKVVDFGISKVKHAGPRLTRASVLMGTPQYMPPEQASGKIDAIDHRSDQWALAVIAWEMLAGRGPFQGKDVTALLYQIVHQDPLPVAARAAGLTAPVEAVLCRALSKRPRDRFPSITAFSRAFETAVLTPPLPADARTASRPGRGGKTTDALPTSPSPWSLGTIFSRRSAVAAPPAPAEPPPGRTLLGPLTVAAATFFRSLREPAAPPPPPPAGPSPVRTFLAGVTPAHLWRGLRRRPRRLGLLAAGAVALALVLLPSPWRRLDQTAPIAVDRPPPATDGDGAPPTLTAAVAASPTGPRRTLRAATLEPMLVRAFCAVDVRQDGRLVRTVGFGKEGCDAARARTPTERAILTAFTEARQALLRLSPPGAAETQEVASPKQRRRRYAQVMLEDPSFRQTLMTHLLPALRAQGIDCPDCAAAPGR
jgi:eukaryotic-like serine/threonine-protein kinase